MKRNDIFFRKIKQTKHYSDCLKSPQMLGLFLFWGYKICVALNKEKDFASFRNLVPIRTIRTIISSHPMPFKISVLKRNHPKQSTYWSLCADLWFSSRKIGNVPAARHLELKSAIWERCEKGIIFSLSFFCWGMRPPSILQSHRRKSYHRCIDRAW